MGLNVRPGIDNFVFGPGALEVFGGPIETDTPVARIPHARPADPGRKMDVEVSPALFIAFAPRTPGVEGQSVLKVFTDLYVYAQLEVVRPLGAFL